jgi:hypothetical protein
MLETAGQSDQLLIFCSRFDFPTEWSAFVNGAGAAPFSVVLQTSYFPYAAQRARRITVDSVTTYAAAFGGKVASVAQTNVNLDDLSSNLTAVGIATLTLPQGNQVMTQVLPQQVFLVMQCHFGMSELTIFA